MEPVPQAFWSIPSSDLIKQLDSSIGGLTSEEGRRRLESIGSNVLRKKKRTDSLTLFVSQFKSPIIIILLFASALSFFLSDQADALIILGIVLASGILGFWQERGAADALAKLLAMVQIKASVLRDGAAVSISIEEIVPGDMVLLSAGDNVPGDCRLLTSRDLFMDEATLTGETYPVEKIEGTVPADTPLAKRTNALFMGTHVVSGKATALVVKTGKSTEFGNISERLRFRSPETEFERGVRRFGYFLMEITLVLVLGIFAINVSLQRPVLDSFLFSLALAVGLTPQLLPAIISINLAHGAKKMAEKRVIVKRLASIENFGSMNILCSDKTGTLTQGVAHVYSSCDIQGKENEKVRLYSYLNSAYQTGFVNPIDEAVRTHSRSDTSEYRRLDELPYDFVRKRLSMLVGYRGGSIMIVKGAFNNVLEICKFAETPEGSLQDLSALRGDIQRQYEGFGAKGLRVLGVAYKNMGAATIISKKDEEDLVFLGFLVLFDPPKDGVLAAIKNLAKLGVSLKVITGDNKLTAAYIVRQVGIEAPTIITGGDIRNMTDEALAKRVGSIDIFAEVEPNQKERIIIAMRKAGHVVGYMGDGINDASALHASDVGISVDTAVDVAKDAADIVLLDKDLEVLAEGVKQGRTTFANTLKYVFMATRANFGNMFSMAGASLFLSFLPLLPKQVLLTNLMTDFPEMAIANDNVDPEMVEKPRRWDIRFIRRFMLTFGLISSIFDYITFAVLLILFSSLPSSEFEGLFRTGWFVESVISASIIVLVIRTRRSFLKSRPGKYLGRATLVVVAVTMAIPFVLPTVLFNFQPLPLYFYAILGGIVALYILEAEIAKHYFYQIEAKHSA